MAKKPKKYDAKFKARVALEAIKGEMTMAELSSKYEIHHSLIHRWKKKLFDELPGIFIGNREQELKENSQKEEKLYQQIGRLSVELEWLKKKYDLFS